LDQNAIIYGCKQGQEKAFKALVDQYAPKLMAVCNRYLKDTDLAKDALQESLISIFKSIASYSGTGSFDGWMTKITVRACLSEIKNRRQLHDLTVVDQQEVIGYDDQLPFEIDDIVKLINELPELQKIVFNMYIVEGFSHAEISTLLNIAESSSRVYLTRARKWLQETIEKSNKRNHLIINSKT
jgi:RNA polymerase sigma-70 factor (ECF subfamily)